MVLRGVACQCFEQTITSKHSHLFSSHSCTSDWLNTPDPGNHQWVEKHAGTGLENYHSKVTGRKLKAVRPVMSTWLNCHLEGAQWQFCSPPLHLSTWDCSTASSHLNLRTRILKNRLVWRSSGMSLAAFRIPPTVTTAPCIVCMCMFLWCSSRLYTAEHVAADGSQQTNTAH